MKTSAALIFTWFLSTAAWSADMQVLDIDVKGMSCPFCVYSVENKLKALDGVQAANVDLGKGRARVIMQPGRRADPEQLHQAIIESGFTPGAITAQPPQAAD